MIALIFCKIKKHTHFFFMALVVGQIKWRYRFQIFQNYFPNAIISVEEDTYAAVYATTKGQQAIVSILGTGSNCSYFDGKELHQKYNHSVISLWMTVVVMFWKRIN
jgi:N-acetylglucosamine kinase-like BadF-type ATPase